MPRKQDPESGRFARVYDDTDFLGVVADLEQAGTHDVADQLGCTQEHAYRRLRTLADNGRIDSRTIGGTRIWMQLEATQSA